MGSPKDPEKRTEWLRKQSEAFKGKPRPDISKALKGKSNPKVSKALRGKQSNHWVGGTSPYFHERARELFGSPICQRCGLTLEEYRLTHKHQKFQMHCISKDFTILEQWNWICVCMKCHKKTHKEEQDCSCGTSLS